MLKFGYVKWFMVGVAAAVVVACGGGGSLDDKVAKLEKMIFNFYDEDHG